MKCAAVLCILFTAGCAGTNITFLTTVIPGGTAAVDVDTGEITLSQGAALAFECTDSVRARPCEDFATTIDDATIAEILPAHLDSVATKGVPTAGSIDGNTVSATQARTGAVLLGASPGSSTVHIASNAGTVDLSITVIAP